MSLRVCVILFAVLIGLASAAKPKEPAKKGECVDNTLYAKYVCEGRDNGEKIMVPGKCSQYYECFNGVSQEKSCRKFFDSATKKCVSQSTCVEVDDTDCVIPTPPPCNGKPSTPTPEPCECPAPPTPAECPSPPTCPTPTECPKPPTCPPPTECPAPPTCPDVPAEPTPKPPCPPPSGGPCGNWFDPNDLYGSFVCKNKTDGTTLATLTSCRDYYYCIGEHSYRKSCGEDQYFSFEFNACDKKSSVYCPLDKKSLD